MVRTDLLLDSKKAAREPIEDNVEIFCLIDLAFCSTRLTVCYKCCGRLEVFEACRTLHAYKAVVTKNVFTQVIFGQKSLSMLW